MPILIAVPYMLTELLAFLAVGKWLGFGWALIALAATFFIGVALAGVQMRTLARRAVDQRDPAGKAAGGLALTATGAVLVAVPGFVTAVLGLLLIIPPTRELLRRLMARQLRRWMENLGVKVMGATAASRGHTSYGFFGNAPGSAPEASPSHEVIEMEEIAQLRDENNR